MRSLGLPEHRAVSTQEQALRERYSAMETEDLLKLRASSDLTVIAMRALAGVLNERGVGFDFRRERIRRELGKHADKISAYGTYCLEEIPPTNLEQAKRSYAKFGPNEAPLVLIDTTIALLDKSRSGLLLTDVQLYSASESGESNSISLSDIQSVRWNAEGDRRLYINGSPWLYGKAKDEDSLKAFTEFLLKVSEWLHTSEQEQTVSESADEDSMDVGLQLAAKERNKPDGVWFIFVVLFAAVLWFTSRAGFIVSFLDLLALVAIAAPFLVPFIVVFSSWRHHARLSLDWAFVLFVATQIFLQWWILLMTGDWNDRTTVPRWERILTFGVMGIPLIWSYDLVARYAGKAATVVRAQIFWYRVQAIGTWLTVLGFISPLVVFIALQLSETVVDSMAFGIVRDISMLAGIALFAIGVGMPRLILRRTSQSSDH